MPPVVADWIIDNLPNLKSVDIGKGIHFVQKDHPKLIGVSIRQWLLSQQLAIVPHGDRRTITVLGSEITVKLSSLQTGGDFYIFEGFSAPGDCVPPHVHSREDEILEVLEGEFDILLGGDHFKAAEGKILFFPRNVAHGFTNSGMTPAKYRIIVSPGANFEKFFEELSTLPSDQPPDMAKMMEVFERYGLPNILKPHLI